MHMWSHDYIHENDNQVHILDLGFSYITYKKWGRTPPQLINALHQELEAAYHHQHKSDNVRPTFRSYAG